MASPMPPPPSIDVERIDFDKKILHAAWHPTIHAVAVAGLNNLYLYQSA
jgi:serine/threonine-protein phosphatase 2A regulatory subunit B